MSATYKIFSNRDIRVNMWSGTLATVNWNLDCCVEVAECMNWQLCKLYVPRVILCNGIFS